jgi:NAD-dependent deacetylase
MSEIKKMEIPKELVERLQNAKHVVVMTGAGVSAESGIKTFRDPDGLWAKLNPAQLASVAGFMANPELVWDWYQHRREIINESKPNPGHYAIASMEKLFPKFTLITQNVDRLHQQAGSTQVWELHGNIIENRCFACSEPYTKEIDLKEKSLPSCPKCGGRIRPAVVWFGEMLPQKVLKYAEESSQDCDVFFSIGTSAEVYPAAGLPLLAKRFGAYVVEVNPNRTSMTHSADLHLQGPSGIVLPEVLEELRKG